MTDYLAQIADVINDQEVWIQSIGFSESEVQFEYMDKERSGPSMLTVQTTVLLVDDEDRMFFYQEVQELARTILVEAWKKEQRRRRVALEPVEERMGDDSERES